MSHHYIKVPNDYLVLIRTKELCHKSFFLWCLLRRTGKMSLNDVRSQIAFCKRRATILSWRKQAEQAGVIRNQQAVDSKPDDCFFVLPHVVVDLCSQSAMSLHAFILFCHVAKCGKCWQSVPTIVSHLKMSNNYVTAAKQELKRLRLLKFKTGRRGQTDTMKVHWKSITEMQRTPLQCSTVRKAQLVRLERRSQYGLKGANNTYLKRDSNNMRPLAACSETTASSLEGNHMQGFLSFNEDDAHVQSMDKFDVDATQQLHAILVKHGTLRGRQTGIKKWAKRMNEFRIGTNNEPELPKEEIKQVIAFLKNNIGRPFCPRVYSITSFIEKYVQLKDAMLRHQEDAGVVHLNDTEQRVIDDPRLEKFLTLSPSTAKHLPAAVKQTLPVFDEFLKRLRTLIKKIENDDQIEDVVKDSRLRVARMLLENCPNGRVATVNWFADIYTEHFSYKKDWKGSLIRFIFDPCNDTARDWVYRMSAGMWDVQLFGDRWTWLLSNCNYDVRQTDNGPKGWKNEMYEWDPQAEFDKIDENYHRSLPLTQEQYKQRAYERRKRAQPSKLQEGLAMELRAAYWLEFGGPEPPSWEDSLAMAFDYLEEKRKQNQS